MFSDISNISSDGRKHSQVFEKLGESIEFSGMAVSHLAMDPKRILKSGKILMTADLAREYGLKIWTDQLTICDQLAYLSKPMVTVFFRKNEMQVITGDTGLNLSVKSHKSHKSELENLRTKLIFLRN